MTIEPNAGPIKLRVEASQSVEEIQSKLNLRTEMLTAVLSTRPYFMGGVGFGLSSIYSSIYWAPYFASQERYA